MNLIGKILTVFIFVMTIVFMTLSIMTYSTHVNWRVNAKALEQKLTTANSEKNDLDGQVTNLTQALTEERNLNQQAIGKLQGEVVALTAEKTEMQAAEAALNTQVREAVAANNAAQTELAQLRTQIADLRGGIVAAQATRDQAFRDMVAKTDQLQQAANDLATFKSRNTQLAEQVSRMEKVLAVNNLNEFDEPGPPQVDGIVLAVRANGIVELSVGADEGLKRGDRLQVVRQGPDNDRYLGAVEILETQPDKSVAKIVPETRQGSIEKEDRVYSRLR
jgi:hypothetical protein